VDVEQVNESRLGAVMQEPTDKRIDHWPANQPRALVLIAASAGGVQAVPVVLAGLPAGFPAAVIVVQHRAYSPVVTWETTLQRATGLRLHAVTGGEELHAGSIYLAPADRHVVVRFDGRIFLTDGRRIKGARCSANPLFETAAGAFGPRVVGVILTGGGSDATDGVQTVKALGGTLIAQDRKTAAVFGMPASAIETGDVDYVLPLEEIAPAITALVTTGTYHRPTSCGGPQGCDTVDGPVSTPAV
jgi:two-component system chemotaxis response regulator CheB